MPDPKKDYVQQSMNDYNFIFAEEGGKRIDVYTTTGWHDEEVAWLKHGLVTSMAEGKKSIILTHHTPSFEVRGAGYAFSSNLEYFFKDYGKKDNSNLLAWMYGGCSPNIRKSSRRHRANIHNLSLLLGHTHYDDDRVMHGTRVVSNQRGYRTEKSKHSYKNNYVVTMK